MKTEKLIVCVHCLGVNNKVGSFVKGLESGKQYTKTFDNCVQLFDSLKYKELRKSHLFV